ncbi:hypothetical protein H6F67_09335 [Microcoleus sp. FACHB-1515]|uniref:hypothetical protein n=1 Tax=Cyanophyceae TaxID=3028117 RepID=UPI0016892A97|nr:hypothetical protein [Microcoleus sp. FACHB-1515]MBD2090054.1 hypothetical protein [Microcoleus sp. FACHB-1515]
MQEKHKVTLYLPPNLHRQLKIRAAVDAEAMSAIAQRAIIFYLNHSEIVDEVEAAHGRAHQVYSCPECSTSLVVRDGEAIALGQQPGLLDDDLPVDHAGDQSGEQALVSV